jgi:hypothetical protein
MSRNLNHSNQISRSTRVTRSVRGSAVLDDVAGLEKIKSSRRQARRQWRKEDRKYAA